MTLTNSTTKMRRGQLRKLAPDDPFAMQEIPKVRRGHQTREPSPVIAGRVPKSLHRQIKAAAKRSGRSMSEELAWRAGLSFELEKATDALYEQIMRAAQMSGRSMSEELAWRARQALEWEKILAFLENARTFIADADKVIRTPITPDKTSPRGFTHPATDQWLEQTALETIKLIAQAEQAVTDDLRQRMRKAGLTPRKDVRPALLMDSLAPYAPELRVLLIGVVKAALAEAKEAGIIKEVPAETKEEASLKLVLRLEEPK
jgi:hypothetical protein